jgi:hypothetical protein
MLTGRITVENHAQKPCYKTEGKQKKGGWTEMDLQRTKETNLEGP